MEQTASPIVQKIVLAFDICSSSSIIEDLTLRNRVDAWQQFLIATRMTLNKRSLFLAPEPYKFTGDGWIILFPPMTRGEAFLKYVTTIAQDIQERYSSSILPLLENPPAVSGVTFGADSGSLLTVHLQTVKEYVGRPINIACRLMNAIKDKDPNPAYKLLMSRPVFNSVFGKIEVPYHMSEVTRKLRNIRGGEDYRCVLMDMTQAR
jgi:hypothetical protein